MSTPPLAELYTLLRAAGFAIGVDDHVRIGRLLACDATWTVELLRTAVEALVVTDRSEREAFRTCWGAWMGDISMALPDRSKPPVVEIAEASRSEIGSRRAARRAWSLDVLCLAVVIGVIGIVAVDSSRPGTGKAPSSRSDAPTTRDVSGGSGSLPASADAGSADPPHAGSDDGSARGSLHAAGEDAVDDASSDDGAPPGATEQFDGSRRIAHRTDLGADITLPGAPTLVVAVGLILLASVAVASLLTRRGRRKFWPGPWHYTLAIPPAVTRLLSPNALEDAAGDLTWRAPGAESELDVGRSVAATVERAGLPALVYRRQTAVPRYLVLEDTAGGAGSWQAIYHELLAGLVREGVALERYSFTSSPEYCTQASGHAVPLGDVLEHADAVIIIGDGAAAVDTLDGRRAAWLPLLHRVPRRLWINPVPPVLWSAGAHAIAEGTPMEHGVAHAVASLHGGVDQRAHPLRPYPAVIERAPETASAVAALRMALGHPAFHLVSAVAVAAPPTLAAARRLAEVLALHLDERDWLAVLNLPWFRAGAWPEGLRDRLQGALEADAPEVAATAAAEAAHWHISSEPVRGSVAHLAWEIEGAARAARDGESALAERALRRIAKTPLADVALRIRPQLGLPDRVRRRRSWTVAIGAMFVVAPTAYSVGFAPSGLRQTVQRWERTDTPATITQPETPDANQGLLPDAAATEDLQATIARCAGLEVAKDWQGLRDCASKLDLLGAQDKASKDKVEEFRVKAVNETAAETLAARLQEALRQGNLREARNQLRAIGSDSVYWASASKDFSTAESRAIDDNRRKAQAAQQAHDCAAVRRLQAAVAAASTPSVADAVAQIALICVEKDEPALVPPADPFEQPHSNALPRNPCDSMNVDDVMSEASNQYAAGFAKAALQLLTKALACKQDVRMYRMATTYACAAHDAAAAKLYYAKVPTRFQPAQVQRCLQEGITIP